MFFSPPQKGNLHYCTILWHVSLCRLGSYEEGKHFTACEPQEAILFWQELKKRGKKIFGPTKIAVTLLLPVYESSFITQFDFIICSSQWYSYFISYHANLKNNVCVLTLFTQPETTSKGSAGDYALSHSQGKLRKLQPGSLIQPHAWSMFKAQPTVFSARDFASNFHADSLGFLPWARPSSPWWTRRDRSPSWLPLPGCESER